MKKIIRWLSLVLFVSFIVTVGPAAAAGQAGISISGAVIPFMDGYAGSGYGAPEYDDAFDNGWGIRVEPFFDLNEQIRGVVGFSRQSWSGRTYLGSTFDDLNLWSFYAGIKVRFLPGSVVRPYVLADLGFASLDSVDLHDGGVSERYWDSTVTYFFDAGGGVEFTLTPNFSMYIDVRVQEFGAPDRAGYWYADAEDGISMPVSFGLNFKW